MEGHDRIMPKKDMAELDRDSAGQHLGALRLAIRLSCQDAVRTLLWYVSKVVANVASWKVMPGESRA